MLYPFYIRKKYRYSSDVAMKRLFCYRKRFFAASRNKK
nr:hypothetical protein BSM_04430 [uncultured archaeon]